MGFWENLFGVQHVLDPRHIEYSPENKVYSSFTASTDWARHAREGFFALSDTRDKLFRVHLPPLADSLGGIVLSGDTYDIHTYTCHEWIIMV